MTEKSLPFDKEKLEEIISKYPTPFHIYDEKGIRSYARRFNEAFKWNEGFREYYAIKAAPNPYLMKYSNRKNLVSIAAQWPNLFWLKG